MGFLKLVEIDGELFHELDGNRVEENSILLMPLLQGVCFVRYTWPKKQESNPVRLYARLEDGFEVLMVLPPLHWMVTELKWPDREQREMYRQSLEDLIQIHERQINSVGAQ